MIGVIKEFIPHANSGIAITYPIAVESSFPLNHLPMIVVYAINRFSEAVPKIILPI